MVASTAHRNYGVKDVQKWKFNKLDIPEVWAQHLGSLSENFRMIIEGMPGHGKTEYTMQLSKMLATYYGKVHFNSAEQGKTDTLHEAFNRCEMHEIEPGKWMLGNKQMRNFEYYFERMQKPNSGRVLIIDSLDYMKLTLEQFKQLHERFPHKSIIIVAWNDPMDTHAKRIKYMCDIKVEVKDFEAKVRSRFGGNKPYVIWKDGYVRARSKSNGGQLNLTM